MAAKVFILGIDGATFDIITPLVESGRAPNFARVMREGTWGPLRSTIHPITPAAWSSFATGKNPGKHGIYDFTAPIRKSYGFKLNNARDRRAASFWAQLGRRGTPVIVANVPFTYPPESVHGIVISGFDTPGADRSMASPPEVYDDLVSHFGSYTPDWSFPAGKRYEPEKYQQEVADVIRRRADATLYLMKRHPWGLFVTVFQSIDHIQHIYFGVGEAGVERIRAAYVCMDDALGRILAALDDETTLIVMSDHGAGEIRKIFYLDQWLEREGYLVPPRGAWLETLGRHLGRRARTLVKRILPVRARGYLRGRMPSVRNLVVSYAAGRPVDWARTRAYSGGMYGNIFLNLKGREGQGIVETAQARELCAEIRSRLLALVDPATGERVVEKVYDREEVYHGAFVEGAPDLLIHWKDYAYFTKKGIDKQGMIFSTDLTLDSSNYPHSGTHRLDGIFIARGAHIRKGETLAGLNITDVAPGVIYLLGNPIPDDMDGRVRAEMFEESFTRAHAPQYYRDSDSSQSGGEGGASQEAEDEELRRRLSSLGYLD